LTGGKLILCSMEDFHVKRLELLEERLHDHIEHYMQNNRALAELAKAVAVQSERMDSLVRLFTEHDKEEDKYQQRVDEHLDKLGAIVDRIGSLDIAKTRDAVDTYRGVLSVKSLIIGLSAVVVAIGVIGTGIIWIVREAINHS